MLHTLIVHFWQFVKEKGHFRSPLSIRLGGRKEFSPGQFLNNDNLRGGWNSRDFRFLVLLSPTNNGKCPSHNMS